MIDVEALAVGYLKSMDDYLGPPALVEMSGALRLPWSSDALSRKLGIEPPPPEERHGALADARWARDLYEKIMGKA